MIPDIISWTRTNVQNYFEVFSMSYKIITDSSCDFTKAQYEQLGLRYAPLTLLNKGEQHDS